jgi:membrane protease YdiL (CAAX protease family)
MLAPAIAFEGGLAVLALGLGWLLGHPPLGTATLDAQGVAIGVLATLPMLLGLWGCLRARTPAFAEIRSLVEALLLPLFAGGSIWGVALVSALAGLGEEMLFRGVLQPAIADLAEGTVGVWLGLLGSSLLFGLAHAVTRMYVVLAGLVGIYLGGLWLVSGNLTAPIVAHGLYDFIAILWLLRRAERQPNRLHAEVASDAATSPADAAAEIPVVDAKP